MDRKLRRDFLSEQIFVADVRQHPLAVHREWRAQGRAAREIAERDMHHLDEPARSERHEFAERHQVVFVVTIEICRSSRR
jgi:hypothetical protein